MLQPGGEEPAMRFTLALSALLLLTAPTWAKDFTKRLEFPAGRFGCTVDGAVVRGDRDVWVVGAGKGQTMTVRVTSLEDNAVFQIDPPGATAFVKGAGEMDDATVWKGKLPSNGDYRIIVGGTRGNASYKLSVEIK